jgi:N-glycosylase/DNA lyase
MEIEIKNNDIILHGVKCLDLELTLDCGQAFRWVKEKDESFSGVASGVYLNISKIGEDTFLLKDTSENDFENIWRKYFDFDRDYVKICETLKEDKLLASTIDEYYGIRILNQDSWEALCSFVISQQNNIKRIKGIIERLCEKYGQEVKKGFYSFPSAERLSKLSVEDFEELGTGYRAKYLEKLAKGVASGEIDLEKIKNLPLENARKELLNIYGVGIKVANCALLFGFGFYNAFPVDVWMKRVMEYYPDGLPKCFDGIGGIAQQYLFHWARNNLK